MGEVINGVKRTFRVTVEVDADVPTRLQEAEMFPCATPLLALQGTELGALPIDDWECRGTTATLFDTLVKMWNNEKQNLEKPPLFRVLAVREVESE